MPRAVIVGGARTPFVRAFAEFTRMDTIDLGVAAVRGLLDQIDVPWDAIDGVVWGGVILPPTAPDVGRAIVRDRLRASEIGFSSTERMTSPALRPARAAGLSSVTSATTAPRGSSRSSPSARSSVTG